MLDKIKAIVMVLRLMFRVISLAVHVALPCVSGDSLFKATSPLILRNFRFCSIFRISCISIRLLPGMAIHLFPKRLFYNHTSFQEA